jgi:hypothetical protein
VATTYFSAARLNATTGAAGCTANYLVGFKTVACFNEGGALKFEGIPSCHISSTAKYR